MNLIQKIKYIVSLLPSGRMHLGYIPTLAASLLLVLLAACSDKDTPVPGGGEVTGNELYIQLNLALNTSTRSETNDDGSSSDGTYDAFTLESTLQDIQMVFLDENDGNYVIDLSSNGNSYNVANKTKITIPVYPEELKKLISQPMKVYLIGNYSLAGSNLKPGLESFSFAGYDSSTDMVFPSGGALMPMVNAEEFIVNFKSLDSEKQITDDEIDAFFEGKSLGNVTAADLKNKVEAAIDEAFGQMGSGNNRTITLERVVARFDYRDAGTLTDNDGKRIANTFPIVTGESGSQDVTDLTLRLTAIQPINVNHSSYLFRHTSEGNGESATIDPDATTDSHFKEVSIFGIENGNPNFGKTQGEGSVDVTSYRWIASNDWDAKLGYYREMQNKSDATSLWAGPKDTDNNDYFFNQPQKSDAGNDFTPSNNWILTSSFMEKTDLDGSKTEYHPVCYMAENTLYSVETMIRGLSTGLAFRVLVCDSEGKPLPEIKNAEALKDKYGGLLSYEDSKLTLTVNGESKVLTYKEDGYYLTYYYFFRHNVSKSDRSAAMPMKFGVVRNNIYRVGIKGFDGLPRPYNPEEPDDPDDDYCIAVDIKVLPWVRRSITVGW